MCSGGVPATGRLPAGTGRGAAQQSQASVADAHWGFCDHLQNVLRGRKTVAALWLYEVFYPIGSTSHSFNSLPSAACRGFHLPVCTKESFVNEHPQEAPSELGSACRGIVTTLGVPTDLLV